MFKWHSLCLVTASIISLCWPQMRAQQPPPASYPGPDDPELYAAWFRLAIQVIQGAERADPAKARVARQGAAASLGIQPEEMPRVLAIARRANGAAEAASAEAQTHFDERSRAKRAPNKRRLQQLELKRLEAIMAGVEEIRRTLSPASWTGFRTRMNDRFRLSMRVVPIPVVPPRTTRQTTPAR